MGNKLMLPWSQTMNPYQTALYNGLMDLVKNNDAFYFADFNQPGPAGYAGSVYRIFNYRLASYTDFLLPHAMECRGTMFEMNGWKGPETPERLCSLPMSKFFNLNENPSTMNLDLTKTDLVELKADGSLISTYFQRHVDHYEQSGHPYLYELKLKSKGSIESSQCMDALKFLDLPENAEFKRQLYRLTMYGYTVNMEWCAPDNRIVIGYMKPALTVLNVRNNKFGDYLDRDDITDQYDEVKKRWVDRIQVDDPVTFAQQIPDMTGVEGYVVRLSNGTRVKIKTNWYLTQHRAKDSINSPRRLYETVLAEAHDDLRSMFHNDPLVLFRIDEMEKFVNEKYNSLMKGVEEFYATNKHLERKEYAILGQQVLDGHQFGLAMMKYVGKEVNYKEFMIKKWKDFGVKDDEPTTVEVE